MSFQLDVFHVSSRAFFTFAFCCEGTRTGILTPSLSQNTQGLKSYFDLTQNYHIGISNLESGFAASLQYIQYHNMTSMVIYPYSLQYFSCPWPTLEFSIH